MLVKIAFLISIFFITQALVPWRLPGENHGVEVRNDDYYEADNPGSKFRLHGNDMIYHGVLSVVTFPTYSSHYDDPAEDPVGREDREVEGAGQAAQHQPGAGERH